MTRFLLLWSVESIQAAWPPTEVLSREGEVLGVVRKNPSDDLKHVPPVLQIDELTNIARGPDRSDHPRKEHPPASDLFANRNQQLAEGQHPFSGRHPPNRKNLNGTAEAGREGQPKELSSAGWRRSSRRS